MTRMIAIVVLVIAAPAIAGAETKVFPLAGALSGDLALAPGAMTARLASELGAAQSSVSIEDAAGLLECAIDKDDCLAAVASSVSADRVVFGVVSKTSTSVRVSVTKYETGGRRFVRTFELAGKTPEQLAEELARAIQPMFDLAPPPVDRPPPIDKPPPTTAVEHPGGLGVTETTSGAPRAPTPLYAWALIGGGVAAAGAGVGFLMSARTLRDDVEAAPTTTQEDFDRLTALEESGRRRTLVGNVLVVAGGVAAATGITLAIVHRARGGSVRVEPAPVAGGAMVMVTVVGR